MSMVLDGKMDIDRQENTIIDCGVIKTSEMLEVKRRRNIVIFLAFTVLALCITYWAYGIGIGGFFAFIFIVIPVVFLSFVYFSKVKRNTSLINSLNPNYVQEESES